MSQQMVGIVIDRLLTDEHLRIRFALDRIETLADLSFLGVELTPDEIDVLIRMVIAQASALAYVDTFLILAAGAGIMFLLSLALRRNDPGGGGTTAGAH